MGQAVSQLGDESGAWVSTRAAEPLRPGSAESDYLRVHARYFLEGSDGLDRDPAALPDPGRRADHHGDRRPGRRGRRGGVQGAGDVAGGRVLLGIAGAVVSLALWLLVDWTDASGARQRRPR